MEAEETEPLETSLESLDQGPDDEEENDVFTLDDQNDEDEMRTRRKTKRKTNVFSILMSMMRSAR